MEFLSSSTKSAVDILLVCLIFAYYPFAISYVPQNSAMRRRRKILNSINRYEAQNKKLGISIIWNSNSDIYISNICNY